MRLTWPYIKDDEQVNVEHAWVDLNTETVFRLFTRRAQRPCRRFMSARPPAEP